MPLPTNVSKRFLPILIVLFCLFLGMGFYGWHATLESAQGKPTWGLVIEQTINLVTGEEAIVVSEQYDEHWILNVARWGIKALLAIALIQSGLLIFRRQIRQFSFRNVSEHQVFLGTGMNNVDLALQAAAEGSKVAIIGEDEHYARRDELEEADILYLAGAPADTLKLKSAGAERAARVVVAACSGDDETIAAAETVAALSRSTVSSSSKGQLLACIQSLEIRELLNQRWKLIANPASWQTRVVSFEAAALRLIVSDAARALAKSPGVMARGPRILLVADEAFARDFLKAAIAFIQVSGEHLPEYFVAVADGKMERAFRMLYTGMSLVAKVHFMEIEDNLIPATPTLANESFDLAVVKLRDESTTLQIADRILRSSQFFVARVNAILLRPPKTQFVEEPRLIIASIFEMGLRSPEFGDLALENLARENHEAYLAGLKPEEHAKAQDYDDLGESFKESNRWAVLHRQIKKSIWDVTEESAKPNIIEHLAICEHQRWMGEKVMDGWRHGSPRDNLRKVHPDICRFSELTEGGREKDRVQVRKALNICS